MEIVDFTLKGRFMAMLSRYQKAGGFIQILQLIETCGKQKQDNFLNMIDAENPRWSAAIREKMLTVEKVLSWPDDVLNEISARLQQLTLATAMHGLKEGDRTRLLQAYSHSQKRLIEDLFKAKAPSPAEISSAYIKILQEVRSMLQNGYLRPEKFAPELAVAEDIEEQLGKSVIMPTVSKSEAPTPHIAAVPKAAGAAYQSSHPANGNGGDADKEKEINYLRTKVQSLTHENNQLKNEMQVFRDKLAQIKRIA